MFANACNYNPCLLYTSNEMCSLWLCHESNIQIVFLSNNSQHYLQIMNVVPPLVEVAYKVVGLVIPALGITHCYEPDCCLVLAVLLYLGNVVGIDIGFTADVYIVRLKSI